MVETNPPLTLLIAAPRRPHRPPPCGMKTLTRRDARSKE